MTPMRKALILISAQVARPLLAAGPAAVLPATTRPVGCPAGVVLADQRVDALVRAVGLALVDQQAGVVDEFGLGKC